MTPGRYPLGPIYRGDTYVWRVVLWFDAMRAQPADLTGYVAKAEIRNAPGSGAFIQHINADIILPNTIDVMISTGASSNLPDTTLVWDLQLTDPRNHEPIMAKPILSKTLSEFWGKRWNLGFRQLAHDLIFRPLHKQIGIAGASLLVFVVSGFIHDLVISLPAHGGYGLPTGYFLLQGFGVSLERSGIGRRLGLQQGFSGWLCMFVFTVGPAFWLFHPAFVSRVILPFMKAIGAL